MADTQSGLGTFGKVVAALTPIAAAATILTFLGMSRSNDRRSEISDGLPPGSSVPAISPAPPTISPASSWTPTPTPTLTPPTPSALPRSPSTRVYLADLEPVEGTWDADVGYLGGDTYPNSVVQGIGCKASSFVDYDLSEDYDRFEAVAGVSDKSDSDVLLRFEVVVDGAVKERWDARLGEVHRVSERVTGALRLRLIGYHLNPGYYKCGSDGWWVFGDPVLIG